MSNLILHCDDCLNALAEMSKNSIDSVVTDSPYIWPSKAIFSLVALFCSLAASICHLK